MMKIFKDIKILVLLFLLVTEVLSAQEILQVTDAIDIALQENFDVQLAQKDIQKAKLNTDIKNTGLLPTVNASGSGSFSYGTAWVKPQDLDFQHVEGGVASQNYSLSVGANYLLYDGSFRKYNWDRLKLMHQFSELEAKALYEQVVMQVYTAYYQVAKLLEVVDNQHATLDISSQRMARAKMAVEFGQSTQLAVLNAQVDMNADSLSINNTNLQIANAKRDLNAILGRDLTTEFTVRRDVLYMADLNEEQILKDAVAHNIQIQAIDKNLTLAELNHKIAKTGYMPTINLSASLNGNFSDFAAGFFDKQVTLGPGIGVQLNWNIFDGGTTKIAEQNAIIDREKMMLQKEQIEYDIESTVRNAWAIHQNNLQTLLFQKANIITAQNNFERSEEKFKAGQISSIDFRQAQLNLLNVQTVYDQSKYDLKLSEINLIQLSGQLIK